MPIEFACNACEQWLQVPSGSEGRSCECPSCGSLQKIPNQQDSHGPSQTSQALGDAARQLPRHPDQNGRVTIACPRCGQALTCSSKLIGSKGQCRQCQAIFVISTNPQLAANQHAPTRELVFSCPNCNQLFAGENSMQGRKGKCHVCGEVFQIQLRLATIDSSTQDPSRSTGGHVQEPSQIARESESASQSSRANPSTGPTLPSSTSSIQFSCSQCGGLLEVPGNAAGKSTACPYCKQILQIPHEGL